MTRYAVVVAFVCALFIGASLAYARLGDQQAATGEIDAALVFPPTPTPSPSPTPRPPLATPIRISYVTRVAFDAVPESAPENLPESFGSVETCRSVDPLQTFNVDIVIEQDTPPPGLRAAGYFIHFNPAVLRVIGYDDDLLIASTGGSVGSIADPLPDSDGVFYIGTFTLPGAGPQYGGTLHRLTFQAQAPGQSELSMDRVDMRSEANIIVVGPATVYKTAHIIVGDDCVAPPDTSTSTPPPVTSTPGPPETEPASTVSDPPRTPRSPASQTATSQTITPAPTVTPTVTPSATQPSASSTVGGATLTPTITPTPHAMQSGDADCNGTVDELDVLHLLFSQAGVGGAPAATCQIASGQDAGDYDCSGGITQLDILYLLMHLAGIDPPTTC